MGWRDFTTLFIFYSTEIKEVIEIREQTVVLSDKVITAMLAS